MTDWRKILVGYLSLLVLGFLDSSRGPVYPDILMDLNLNDTWGSLFFILVSVMSVFTGQLTPEFVRSYSLANAMRAGHFFMFLGILGMGASPNFTWLIVACLVFGIGFGFINVGQNFMIIEGSTPKRRRQLLSGLHSVYAGASLVSPACVSLLNVFGWDWRKVFYLFSVFPVIAFFATFIVKEDNELKENVLADERGFIRGLVSWKTYFIYATQLSLYVSAEIGLVTRLVLYLRREFDYSDVVAPQFLSAFFACFLIGRLVFSFFPFSRWTSHQIISTSLILSTVFFTLGLIFSPYLLVMCGFAMAPVFGYSLDYLSEMFPNRSNAAIASTLAMSGIYIVVAHYLIGLFTEMYGIGTAMFICPMFLILSFAIFQFLPRSGPVEEN